MSESKPSDALREIREQLAAIEHERWAAWQKYCHEVIRKNTPPSAELELVLRRWDKQIITPFAELSEDEQSSDMEQVDRYWPLIQTLLQREYERGRLAELDRLEPSCMLWVRYDGGYYGQDHAERVAEIKAKEENHGE